ncbi:collagen alpha-1(I) chain-like [Amphibalanus amphitrite]|uniref:collagen alpha-1(I) chain-like n=1 Tax=Amphibalanus amphitrite TaxID=1232801 RepID=UPI001C91D163|nr:collagen alpha-1(I) chain-like [Amphibalanus amphitrite]
MIMLRTHVLPLFGLVPLVASFAGPPFEPVFFDGRPLDGELVFRPPVLERRLGRLERHAPASELTPDGLLGANPAQVALEELVREPRIGERVRTQINYAAGKQPIVVKVSPRPYAPLPQVERPLGAASAALPRPVPSPSRPFQGSINGFKRPEDVFGPGPGSFNSFGGGGSFSGGGSFGRPSVGRPGNRFPSRPRPVVRPGFVIRDNPPTSPPFPETVTGPPYRPPPNGGLREVYRPKPEGPFFVQGRTNPNRRGLLAEEVAVNAVGERPHLALVEVSDRTERPLGISETPVSGGRLTARGPLDGGTMQLTNVHTVSRVQRPPGAGQRGGRLLNGFAAGVLGFPPTPPSAPTPLQIAASTLEPAEISSIAPSGAVRFTDSLSLTLGGPGLPGRPPISVTPAGGHGIVSQIRTAGPTAPGFLGTSRGASVRSSSGSSTSRRPAPTTSHGRSRKMPSSRRPPVTAGPTGLPFLPGRSQSVTPAGLGVAQALTASPPTPHPLLQFTSPSAVPFTADPFGTTAALTQGPTAFSLPNGQLSFPSAFGGGSQGFGFSSVATQRQLGAGGRSFNGQTSLSPPRSPIPAGPRLPDFMSRDSLRPSRHGQGRVAGPALPFESPPAAGSQQTFGTVRPPFQNQFDPRVRCGFQPNSGLGLGRTLEQEFAAAFGTDAFLTGNTQQPTAFGATGGFQNQLGLGRGQGAVNQGLFPTAGTRGRGLFNSPSGIGGRNNGFPTTAGAFNNRGQFPAGRGGNGAFSSPTGPSTRRGLFPTTQTAANRNGLFPSLTSPSSPLNVFPTTFSNRGVNSAFGSASTPAGSLNPFSTTPSGRSTNGLLPSLTSPSTTLNPFSTNPTLQGRGNFFTSPTRLPNNRGFFPTTPSSQRGLFTPSGRSTSRGAFPTSPSVPTRSNRFRPSTPSGFSDLDRGVTRAGPTMPGRRRATEDFPQDFEEEVRYFEPPGRQAALSDERLRQASSASSLAGTSLALLTATLLRMMV